ncbi:MAG TPA: DUF2442 domain-containing protein [Gemmatimonadales bacterium]
MIRPTEVRPEAGYRLWLRYEDEAEGTVDLSDLAGRGVFEAWNDPKIFEAVRVGASGALEWPDGIDLCGDALYMRLTGKAPDDVFPSLRSATVDA